MAHAVRNWSGLFLAAAVAAAPASAAPVLRVGGQQVEIEDPVQWGSWVADVEPAPTAERKAGGYQMPYYIPPRPGSRSTGPSSTQRMNDRQLQTAPSPEHGSVTVVVPAGMCTPGAHYPSVTLAADQGSYALSDVTVAGCSAVPKKKKGERPAEAVSFNYGSLSVSYVPQD